MNIRVGDEHSKNEKAELQTQISRLLRALERPLDLIFIGNLSVVKRLTKFLSAPQINGEAPIMIVGGFGGSGKTKHLAEIIRKHQREHEGWWLAHHVLVSDSVLDDAKPEINWAKLISSIRNKVEQVNSASVIDRYRRLTGMPLFFRLRYLVPPRLRTVEYIQRFLKIEHSENPISASLKKMVAPFWAIKIRLGAVFAATMSPSIAEWLTTHGVVSIDRLPFLPIILAYHNWIVAAALLLSFFIVLRHVIHIRTALKLQGLTLGNPLRADLYHDVAAKSQDVHRLLLKAILADVGLASKSCIEYPFVTSIIIDFEQLPDHLVDGHEVRGLIQDLDQFYRESLLPYLNGRDYIVSPRLVFASKVWRYGLRELPALPLITVPELNPSEIKAYFQKAAATIASRLDLSPILRRNALLLLEKDKSIGTSNSGPMPASSMIANEVRLLCQAWIAGQSARDAAFRALEQTRRRHLNLRYEDTHAEYEDDRAIKSMQVAAIMPWVREDEYELIRGEGCFADLLPYHQLRRHISHLLVSDDDLPCVASRIGFEIDPRVRLSFLAGNYAACCAFAYGALFKRFASIPPARELSSLAVSDLEKLITTGVPAFRAICFYPEVKWISDNSYRNFLELLLLFLVRSDLTKRSVRRLLSDCLESLLCFYETGDRNFSNDYGLDEIEFDLAQVNPKINEVALALVYFISQLLGYDDGIRPDVQNAIALAAGHSKLADHQVISSVVQNLSTRVVHRQDLPLDETIDIIAVAAATLARMNAWSLQEFSQTEPELLQSFTELVSLAGSFGVFGDGHLSKVFADAAAHIRSQCILRESLQPQLPANEPLGPYDHLDVEVFENGHQVQLDFVPKEKELVQKWLVDSAGVEKRSLSEILRVVLSGIRLGVSLEPRFADEKISLDQKVSLLDGVLIDIFMRGQASDRTALLHSLVAQLARMYGNDEYAVALFRKSQLVRHIWLSGLLVAEEPSRRLMIEVRCWLVLKGAVHPTRLSSITELADGLTSYIDSDLFPFDYSIATLRYELIRSSLLGLFLATSMRNAKWNNVASSSLDDLQDMSAFYDLAWRASWGIHSSSKRVAMGDAMIELARAIGKVKATSLAACYEWAKKGYALIISNATDESDVWERCTIAIEELEKAQGLQKTQRFYLARLYRQSKKAFRHGALQVHHNKIRLIGSILSARDDERPKLRAVRLAAYAVAKFLLIAQKDGAGSNRELLTDYALRVISRFIAQYEGRLGSLGAVTSIDHLLPKEREALERFLRLDCERENIFRELFNLLAVIANDRFIESKVQLAGGDLTFARVASVRSGRVELEVAGYPSKVFVLDGVDEHAGNLSKMPSDVFRAVRSPDEETSTTQKVLGVVLPIVVRRQGVAEEMLPITARGLPYILKVLNLLFPTEPEAEALRAPVIRTRIDAQGKEVEIRHTDIFLGASNTWIAWRVSQEDLTWLLASGGWFIRHLQAALFMRRITLFPRSPDRTREGVAREIKHFVNNSYAALRIELIGKKIAVKNWEEDPRKNRTFKSMFLKVFDREIEQV